MTSLVTRCPACSTLFKVVPDQLRISEGWVRCGQCDEVFDAQAQMQAHIVVVPDVAPSNATAVTPPAPAAEPPHEAAVDEQSVLDESTIDGAMATAYPASEPVAESLREDDDVLLRAVPDVGDEISVDTEVVLQPEIPAAGQEAESAVDFAPVQGRVSDALPRFEQSPVVTDVEDVHDFQASFLRSSPRARSGRLPWLHKLMVSLLGLALVLQVVVQQRDRIAATEPALASALNVLCQPFGCEVQPLRQIESIVIESSSFIKVKADVYRLSFSIKNTALVPLALPFAELALTDLRDQSVLRRVLAPTEYGARAETLGPGDELAVVVPVSVKATAATGDKIAGYRLLVFYP